MKNIILLVLFTLGVHDQVMAQDQRLPLVKFIEQKLSTRSSQTAESLCSAVTKEYGLKNLDAHYTQYVSSVLTQKKQNASTGDRGIASDVLYHNVIATLFLSPDDKIVLKKLGCDEARSNLDNLIRQLPGAISSLLDCIEEVGWEDAIQGYNKVDFITGFLTKLFINNYALVRGKEEDFIDYDDPLHRYDPHHPDFPYLGCMEEIERLRAINLQLAQISDKCR